MEKAMERAKRLISQLGFGECVALYHQLEKGHPMIDLLFDRMEELDANRFDEWLEKEE